MRVPYTQSARLARAALALTATVMFSLLLTTCGGGGTPTPKPRSAALTITTTSLPEGSIGQSYGQSLTATGGTPPYTWSLASESDPIPSGLTLSASGYLSGVPTEAGDFNISVRVQDASLRSATKTLALKIIALLQIIQEPLPSGIVGRPYNYALRATGGFPPYNWMFIGGHLHTGLTLSADGIISGTPTEVGYDNLLGVQIQDSRGETATSGFLLTISPIMDITTTTLPNANVWIEYWQEIYILGGVAPWEMNLATGSGPLPPGLVLGGAGYFVIHGTPTTPGTYTFTLQLKDSGSVVQTATRELTLVVENHLVFPAQSEMPLGVIHQGYAEAMLARGGTAPYSWSIVSGSLPPGLALNTSTGQITGIPTVSGIAVFNVRVTDSGTIPESLEGQVTLNIRPELNIRDERFPDGVLHGNYANNVLIDGGRPPISLRISSGGLPPGISQTWADPDFAAYGFGGTPTGLGTYPFTVEATDSTSPPGVVTRNFSIRVNEALVFETTTLPDGITGTPYEATLVAHGGVLPYTWSVVVYAPLPRGLALDSTTGRVSGTPTEAFRGYVGLTVQDSASPPQTWTKHADLRIVERLAVSTSTIPSAKPSQPIAIGLAAKGGTLPYAWSITSGTLPSGLTFDSTSGRIAGTPTAEGTFDFTVQVTDAGPPVQTASRALSLTIDSHLGRNDSPATATPISNGTFRASISPYADPVAGPANPDHDYYAMTANPGAVVAITTMAKRLTPESPLDTVIEIVDAAGNRLSPCRTYSDQAFDQPCLNDDFELGIIQDSRLEFKVPDSATEPVTFYVRVLSWDGSARPDYVYDLVVSGAN